MVYILFVIYPYEGRDVVTIFEDESKANTAMDDAIKNDDTKGYNKYTVEEFEVKT